MFIFELRGIKISFPKNPQDVLRDIEKIIATKRYPSQIVTLNTLIYYQTKRDFETYAALKNASLVLPDSFGITFFCSIFNFRILKRYPGINLIHYICLLAKEKKYKIYLLGATQEVVEKTKSILKDRYFVNIVGCHNGYIFNDNNLSDKIVKDISEKVVDILLVGLPTEIQERWIYKNLHRLNCKIAIGLGGSFDVISGKLKRAPKIFQYIGLEWYYRLLIEPWRIKRIVKLPLAVTFLIYDCIKKIKILKFMKILII